MTTLVLDINGPKIIPVWGTRSRPDSRDRCEMLHMSRAFDSVRAQGVPGSIDPSKLFMYSNSPARWQRRIRAGDCGMTWLRGREYPVQDRLERERGAGVDLAALGHVAGQPRVVEVGVALAVYLFQ